MPEPLLEVEDLTVDICQSHEQVLRIVDGVSLTVNPGSCLGIVGESGSGKSVTLLSLFELLLGIDVRLAADTFRFMGKDVDLADRRELTRLLRNEISVIFQDPMTSLNPVMTVGAQIAEVVRAQGGHSTRAEVNARVVELLTSVEIPKASERVRNYPHEFSGGQRQRIMIALALAKEPRLIIADEPTTALDVTTQAQVLRVLKNIQTVTGSATIFVSHDLGVVSHVADSVAVLYGGRLIECGPVDQLFSDPAHPYTASLLRSIPPLERTVTRLFAMPGEPPDPMERPAGCVFQPRCPIGSQRALCDVTQPDLTSVTVGRKVACHFWQETATIGESSGLAERVCESNGRKADLPVLSATGLRKEFRPKKSFLLPGSPGTIAVDDIDLNVHRGSTLALVGESGCGKTTTAKMLGQLIRPTSGRLKYKGQSYESMTRSDIQDFRRRVQFVFQDPYASMNPRMAVGDIIAEPLVTHSIGERHERRERVEYLLERVGLRARDAERFPHQFSGGQRQRIAVARALAPEPELLILDEPTSALDVSVQAQVLNLLIDIKEDMDMTAVFISHDLSVVRQVADEVAVMYQGRIVELGAVEEVISQPVHEYTRSLVGSVMALDRSE